MELGNISGKSVFAISKVMVDIWCKKQCIGFASRVGKRLKTWDLWKLGNIRKILEFGVDRT